MQWMEARDAAKHPVVHGAAPCNKELSSPNSIVLS